VRIGSEPQRSSRIDPLGRGTRGYGALVEHKAGEEDVTDELDSEEWDMERYLLGRYSPGVTQEEEMMVYQNATGAIEGPHTLQYFQFRLGEGTIDPNVLVWSPFLSRVGDTGVQFKPLQDALAYVRRSSPAAAPPTGEVRTCKQIGNENRISTQSEKWGALCEEYTKAMGLPNATAIRFVAGQPFPRTIGGAKQQRNALVTSFESDSSSTQSERAVREEQANYTRWAFSVFNVPVEGRVGLVASIFKSLQLDATVAMESVKFRGFVKAVQAGMSLSASPYHNFEHALDVLHGTFVMLSSFGASSLLEPLEVLGVTIAAVSGMHESEECLPALVSYLLRCISLHICVCVIADRQARIKLVESVGYMLR
jgi:hypothetical protein